MSTCNRLDLQTLGSQPVMPKNLPDHCPRRLFCDNLRFRPGPNHATLHDCGAGGGGGVGILGGKSFHFHQEEKSLSTFQGGNKHTCTQGTGPQTMNKLGFRVYITVVGCYLVRFLMFSNFDHFDLHNKTFCCVEEFTIKHQLKLDETSNIPLFNYGYRKCMFVNLGLKLQYQSQDLVSYYEDFLF